MSYKEGDVVRVTTDEEVIEGVLLPRPEILDKEVLVLKLNNGYNIGIDKKRVKNIALVEPYKPKKVKQEKTKKDPNLPSVSILSTGGTISSRLDYRTGGVVADYTAEDFVAMCPELKGIANIHAESIMSVMSEDITFNDWKRMAEMITKEVNKSDVAGVVVTQGTDTLHFSTAMMSFMLKDLHKPVIFTAAQRSIDRGSSDAFMNLICATKAAAHWDGAEVVTCLHGTSSDDYCTLIRGTKVRKMHTSRRDAFRPINEPHFAEVKLGGKLTPVNTNHRKRSKGKTSASTVCEKKTALIQIHPSMDPKIIDFYVKEGYRGIVLSATALGHVPTEGEGSLLPALENAIKKGVSIVIASQTLYGRTHQYVYANLRKLSIQLDCIFAEDMLPETAWVKLAWVLGHAKDNEKVRKEMRSNIVGEINLSIGERSFLN